MATELLLAGVCSSRHHWVRLSQLLLPLQTHRNAPPRLLLFVVFCPSCLALCVCMRDVEVCVCVCVFLLYLRRLRLTTTRRIRLLLRLICLLRLRLRLLLPLLSPSLSSHPLPRRRRSSKYCEAPLEALAWP